MADQMTLMWCSHIILSFMISSQFGFYDDNETVVEMQHQDVSDLCLYLDIILDYIRLYLLIYCVMHKHTQTQGEKQRFVRQAQNFETLRRRRTYNK